MGFSSLVLLLFYSRCWCCLCIQLAYKLAIYLKPSLPALFIFLRFCIWIEISGLWTINLISEIICEAQTSQESKAEEQVTEAWHLPRDVFHWIEKIWSRGFYLFFETEKWEIAAKRKSMAGQSVFSSLESSSQSARSRCCVSRLTFRRRFRCKCISTSSAYQIPWQVPLKILAAGSADDYSLLNYLYVLTVCKLPLMWVELLITRQAGSQSREKSEQFIWFGSVSTAAPSFEAGAHFMNGLFLPRLAMVSPDFCLPLALAKIVWAKCLTTRTKITTGKWYYV